MSDPLSPPLYELGTIVRMLVQCGADDRLISTFVQALSSAATPGGALVQGTAAAPTKPLALAERASAVAAPVSKPTKKTGTHYAHRLFVGGSRTSVSMPVRLYNDAVALLGREGADKVIAQAAAKANPGVHGARSALVQAALAKAIKKAASLVAASSASPPAPVHDGPQTLQ